MSSIRQLKILITTPSFPPFNSGLGNAVSRQAKILSSLGFIIVVATNGRERRSRIDNSLKVQVEEFNVSGSDSFLNPLYGDLASYKMFLIESNFDLILMNGWQTWSTDICIKYLNIIPGRKVLYSHCLSTNIFFIEQPFKSLIRYLAWRPYFFKVKKILKRLDALICVASEGVDSRFKDVRLAKGIDIPIYVVPNALSDDAVYYSNIPAPDFDSRGQIISVGSYDWQKGHDFVLRAYAMSASKNILPLKIFGQEFTPFTNKLKEQAKKLGIRDDFIYFYEGVSGKVLLEEYRKSLVFLYGSRTECQPLVILDAMATGTPFVSKSTGCIASLAGGSAVTSVKMAASSLNILVSDRLEWLNKSIAGLDAVKAYHNPSSVRTKLETTICELIN